jgi:hypothetical protein
MRRLLLALALVGTLVACGDDADPAVSAGGDGDPTDEPAIVGEVTASAPFTPVTEECIDGSELPPDAALSSDDPPICTPEDNDVLGSIVVASADGDQGSLTITGETDLGDSTFDDLAVGTVVSVWVSGPIAESFPWQATADAVRVEP